MRDMISVIIPVYNSEKFLFKCIQSVCKNKYKELEIIVINDGSTDKSGELCDILAAKDSRIKVIHQKNTGVSIARNKGLTISNGKYVAFLDSDDFIPDNYFEKLYYTMVSSDCDMAIGSIAHINGNKISYSYLQDRQIDFNNIRENDRDFWLQLNEKFLLYGPCNKLYKRQIIENKRIRFPNDTSYGEDLLFNFCYLNSCSKITYNKLPFYYYNHDSENSLSKKCRVNMYENGLRLNQCIKNFSIAHKLFTLSFEKYLSRRIFDDAYNTLFSLFHKGSKLNFKSKLKYARNIMNNKELMGAFQSEVFDGYSYFYVHLIKRKWAFMFCILNFIRTVEKRREI